MIEPKCGCRIGDYVPGYGYPIIQCPLCKAAPAMLTALETIAAWRIPPSGEFFGDGTPKSYAYCFGSNGERDVMRDVAAQALAAAEGRTP